MVGRSNTRRLQRPSQWQQPRQQSRAYRNPYNTYRYFGTDMEGDVGLASSSGRPLAALLRAASEGDVSRATQLLTEGGDSWIGMRDPEARTPLHLASRNGHAELVELLIVTWGADVNALDNSRLSPLHHAAQNGHTTVARVLWQHGAKVNVTDGSMQTPLHLAARNGHGRVSQFLVEEAGANPIATTRDQSTPLHLAAESSRGGAAAVVDVLGSRGHAMTDENGQTPLHRASVRGNLAAAKLLLVKGANANVTDVNGLTPMHLAPRSRAALDMVKLLQLWRGDIWAKDPAGVTVLHMAAKEWKADLVKHLLNQGMNANTLDSDGWTPLLLACHGYDHATERRATVQELYNRGANVHASHHEWGSALQIAIHRGQKRLVMFLLEKGVSVHIVVGTLFGTPLQAAAVKGRTRLILELLKKRPDINAAGGRGGSALNAAAFKGRQRVVRLLVSRGASITTPARALPSCAFKDAVQAAQMGGHDEVVQWLRDAQNGTAKMQFEPVSFPDARFGYITRRAYSLDSDDTAGSNDESEAGGGQPADDEGEGGDGEPEDPNVAFLMANLINFR